MNHRFASLFPAWDLLEQLHHEVARHDQRVQSPDFWSDENAAYVSIAVPGVDPAAIDVTVDDEVISISVEREFGSLDEGARWLRRERPTGQLKSSYRLPFPADAQAIDAEVNHGVLSIRVPKAASARPVSVPVAAGSSATA